eukprot:3018454-Pleurochrysis_carterae.AAC.2
MIRKRVSHSKSSTPQTPSKSGISQQVRCSERHAQPSAPGNGEGRHKYTAFMLYSYSPRSLRATGGPLESYEFRP